MKPKIIIVSGYFNPIHKGHLEHFIHAKTKGRFTFCDCEFRLPARFKRLEGIPKGRRATFYRAAN